MQQGFHIKKIYLFVFISCCVLFLWFATIFGYTDPNLALHGIHVENRLFAIGGFGNNFANFNVNMFGYLAYIYLPLLLLPVYKFHDNSSYSFDKIRLTFAYLLLFSGCLILQALIFNSGLFGNLIKETLAPHIGLFGTFIVAFFIIFCALLLISKRASTFTFKYMRETLQMAGISLRITLKKIFEKIKTGYADLNLDYLQRAKNKMLNQEYSEIFTPSGNKHIFHEPLIEKPLDEYPREILRNNQDTFLETPQTLKQNNSINTNNTQPNATPLEKHATQKEFETFDIKLSTTAQRNTSDIELKIHHHPQQDFSHKLDYLQYNADTMKNITHVPRTQVRTNANDEDMLKRFQKANTHIKFSERHVFQSNEINKEQPTTFTLKKAEESPNPLESFARTQNKKNDFNTTEYLFDDTKYNKITPKTINVAQDNEGLQITAIKVHGAPNIKNEDKISYNLENLTQELIDYTPHTQTQQHDTELQPKHFQLNKAKTPPQPKKTTEFEFIQVHTPILHEQNNQDIPTTVLQIDSVEPQENIQETQKFQYANMPLESNYKTFDMGFTQTSKTSKQDSPIQDSVNNTLEKNNQIETDASQDDSAIESFDFDISASQQHDIKDFEIPQIQLQEQSLEEMPKNIQQSQAILSDLNDTTYIPQNMETTIKENKDDLSQDSSSAQQEKNSSLESLHHSFSAEQPNYSVMPTILTSTHAIMNNGGYNFQTNLATMPNIDIPTQKHKQETLQNNFSSISDTKGDNFIMQEPTIQQDIPSHTQISSQNTMQDSIISQSHKEVLSTVNSSLESSFTLPPLKILQEPIYQAGIQDEELDNKIAKMIQTLNAHKIKGDIVGVFTGPVVTTFEFRPEAHVKVNKVTNHRNDLALGLKAKSIRIQAPIPGKDVIGIEIPNNKVETIYLREILQSHAFLHAKDPLTIVLGKNIVGEPIITNLAKLPHLLVAGTTGSGKSVGVNAIILSLLYRNSPDDLKLMMIDPKQVEFAPYEDLPHLITPIINAPNKAIKALQAATVEMDKRYELLSQLKVKNISSYNEKAAVKMPNFVIIIDELADLMLTGGKEAETFIARLAQMGRAAGIHLIIATQRSSVNVVTGLIKTNLPSRISYRVGSKVDSKVILDESGAEELLGNGDGLFKTADGLIRIHAPWVSEQEVEKIVDFIKAQREPEYDDSFLAENKVGINMGDKFVGEGGILDEAKAIMLNDNKTSISNLQRKMGIGYNKAASIVEALEQEGFLSAPNTKGERQIL